MTTTLVRLNHPYNGCNPGDILELDTTEARRLIQQFGARDVDDLINHIGGGYYMVELHNPKRFVQTRGRDAGLERLRRNE